jgi:hypothetical protein
LEVFQRHFDEPSGQPRHPEVGDGQRGEAVRRHQRPSCFRTLQSSARATEDHDSGKGHWFIGTEEEGEKTFIAYFDLPYALSDLATLNRGESGLEPINPCG